MADRSEGQVSERPSPFPPLVPVFRDDTLRSSRRIEFLIREPVDPRQAVTVLSASLGVEKVVCEDRCVLLGEPECQQTSVGLGFAQRNR